MYRAAIHGDLEAFELLIRKMSRPLFAIAFGALQNREEAEDAVQDAFVKAWKARGHVRNSENLPAWIATIVRNRAHDILMRRRTVPGSGDSKRRSAFGHRM
jgi:RNA polymerase sigma-70 factor, ECF subfamily